MVLQPFYDSVSFHRPELRLLTLMKFMWPITAYASLSQIEMNGTCHPLFYNSVWVAVCVCGSELCVVALLPTRSVTIQS